MGKNKDRLNQKSIPWADSILEQVINLPAAGGEDLQSTAEEQVLAVENLLKMVNRKVSESKNEGLYVWNKWRMDYIADKLPSGYTLVEYIESTGTQHIDTGVKLTSNSKVVMDCDITLGPSWTTPFGSYSSGANFSLWADADGLVAYYKLESKEMANNSGRGIVTMDRNVWSNDVVSISFAAADIASSITAYIFFVNGGDDYPKALMKLYSLKMYDNDVIVRDYVPCVDPSGEAGLYDLVNNVFYKNIGTGTFVVSDNEEFDPPYELIDATFVVSDSEATYPNGGALDDYWYELVEEGISGIDYGFVAPATDVSSVTISHNLNAAPSYALIASTELNTKFGSEASQLFANVLGYTMVNNRNANPTLVTTRYASTVTDTETTFKAGSNIKFLTGKKYLWVVIA